MSSCGRVETVEGRPSATQGTQVNPNLTLRSYRRRHSEIRFDPAVFAGLCELRCRISPSRVIKIQQFLPSHVGMNRSRRVTTDLLN